MPDHDSSPGSEDPLEALRKLFRNLGLPENMDVNDAEARTDLFRTMMSRLMPMGGIASPEETVWTTAQQTARHVVANLGPDPSGSSRAARRVADAVHLSDLWLSEATILPPITQPPAVWSRAEWIEASLPAWKSMIEPVVQVLSAGIADATGRSVDLPESGEMAGLTAMLHPLMSRAVSAMFGAHVGESIGWAATATMTGTDLGLPVLPRAQVIVLPTNLSAIEQQAELDEESLLMFCALRESARQRLFKEIGWIAPQIIALVQHYAREMRVDPDAIASAMHSAVPDQLSPESVAAFQNEFAAILFTPEHTEEQTHIIERLSTLLALVEGWVEDVTTDVARRWLPDWEALWESLRRNRATSKLTQSSVTSLIGLRASPKAIREAAGFWAAMREARGVEGRDDIWHHPESMPQAEHIAQPATYLDQPDASADSWDDELRRLLDGDSADDTPDSPQP